MKISKVMLVAMLAGLLSLSGMATAEASSDRVFNEAFTTEKGWVGFKDGLANNGLLPRNHAEMKDVQMRVDVKALAKLVCKQMGLVATSEAATRCPEYFLATSGINELRTMKVEFNGETMVKVNLFDLHKMGEQKGFQGVALPTAQQLASAEAPQAPTAQVASLAPPAPKEAIAPPAARAMAQADVAKVEALQRALNQATRDIDRLKGKEISPQEMVDLKQQMTELTAQVETVKGIAGGQTDEVTELSSKVAKIDEMVSKVNQLLAADQTKELSPALQQVQLDSIQTSLLAADGQLTVALGEMKAQIKLEVLKDVDGKFSSVWLAIGAVASMLLAVFFYARSGNRRSKNLELVVLGDGKAATGLVNQVLETSKQLDDLQKAVCPIWVKDADVSEITPEKMLKLNPGYVINVHLMAAADHTKQIGVLHLTKTGDGKVVIRGALRQKGSTEPLITGCKRVLPSICEAANSGRLECLAA